MSANQNIVKKLSQAPGKLLYLKHYKKEYVKGVYGRYGRSSGLNPGVMYPRKEELTHMLEYERCFHLELQELLTYNKECKQKSQEFREKREKEVFDNLAKLPAAMRAFFDKLDAKKKEQEEWLKKKEAAIEEVRAILGYTAKPTDPKFQEALLKKEEEEIKARKKEEKKRRENEALETLLEAAKSKSS